jgi:malonate-semialdehyde dehydrogenase (acetylating)/methylmalonate-semialdehyde dehydrogenase
MTPKPALQGQAADTVKLLINGTFVESKTTEWHDVINPATQEVLAQVPFATDGEIDAAVAAAKEAYKTWKHTPLAARARIML